LPIGLAEATHLPPLLTEMFLICHGKPQVKEQESIHLASNLRGVVRGAGLAQLSPDFVSEHR
jgi:hypothetical protein